MSLVLIIVVDLCRAWQLNLKARDLASCLSHPDNDSPNYGQPNGIGITNTIVRAEIAAIAAVILQGHKDYKGKRPQSRHLTASLFINTHEVMKKKRKFVVILVQKNINILGIQMVNGA
eukprot:1158190-Pelagomonas_calceolata.AAC.11